MLTFNHVGLIFPDRDADCYACGVCVGTATVFSSTCWHRGGRYVDPHARVSLFHFACFVLSCFVSLLFVFGVFRGIAGGRDVLFVSFGEVWPGTALDFNMPAYLVSPLPNSPIFP